MKNETQRPFLGDFLLDENNCFDMRKKLHLDNNYSAISF